MGPKAQRGMCWEEMVLGCLALRILGPVCQSPKPTPPPLLQKGTQVRGSELPLAAASWRNSSRAVGAGWGHRLRTSRWEWGRPPTRTHGDTPPGARAYPLICGPRRVLPHLRRQSEPPRFPAGAGRPPHWGARESPGPPFGLQMVMGVGLLDRGEKRARSVPEKGVSGKAYKREPSVAL